MDAYGENYLSPQPRTFKGKVKNAQEAHEAIRPAGDRVRTVQEVAQKLGPDEARVYEIHGSFGRVRCSEALSSTPRNTCRRSTAS